MREFGKVNRRIGGKEKGRREREGEETVRNVRERCEILLLLGRRRGKPSLTSLASERVFLSQHKSFFLIESMSEIILLLQRTFVYSS